MVDIIFLIDIIVMFFTSYLDKKGHECRNSREIANNYISQLRFKVDCLSLIGTDAFAWIHRYAKLFGLFKLMRVFRLGNLINQSNTNKQSKAVLNLGKIGFYLFFYLHVLSCYWWLVCGYG